MLSGYLPDEKHQGVSALFDGQMSEHSKRRRPKDILCLGLLRRQKVTTEEDSDKEATITMKWAAVEPITGDEAEVLMETLTKYRESRLGDQLVLVDGQAPE